MNRNPERLINQLVVGHERLYVHSAYFRYMVDSFAQFAFEIMDGFAAAADDLKDRQTEEMRQLMEHPHSLLDDRSPVEIADRLRRKQ